MAPPGRRRNEPKIPSLVTTLLLCVVLLCSSPAFAASAVLGIDVGTEFIKASLVKPGIPLEIVITKDSKRKEAAAIAFKPSTHGTQGPSGFPERLYGGDAMALHARFPGEVFPNLKPLLNVPSVPHLPVMDMYNEKYPAIRLQKTNVGSTVGILSNNFNSSEPSFMVEELLAMQLKNIRHNAELMAGKAHVIRNAVFTVPAFYTAAERSSLMLAANLAGLEVMGLMSDGLAVGLNYAMTRTFPNIDKGEKAEHHLVYDMGAGSTTASVLKFQAREVKDIGRFNKTIQEVSVIGAGWNAFLGGDLMNSLIINDMLKQFVESSGAKAQSIQETDVRKHGRAMAKIWREAEKLRHVLSANTVASTSFEEFYADVDFKYKISRPEFEALTSEAFTSRIGEPLAEALSKAQLTMDDIDSVVLHGGAVRTPFVQRELENIVGNAAKLKTNVNADEAAVFGAGFKAAGLSPSFRVKEIRDSDSAGYGVNLIWEHNNKVRQQRIFQSTSQTGVIKHMSFKNLDDFSLTLEQDAATKDTGRAVVNVQFTNLTNSVAELTDKYGCKRVNITNTVTLRLDPVTGLPEVHQASVSCEVEPEKKGSIADGVKSFLGFGGKKDQDVLEDDETLSEVSSSATDNAPTETETSKSTSIKKDAKKDSKKDTKEADVKEAPKSYIQTIRLSFVSKPLGLSMPSESELERILERLNAFDVADEDRVIRSETFNNLEAFTYRARDMLNDDSFIEASTLAERKAIEGQLKITSDWLGDEGLQATLEAVKAQLKTLKDLVRPITKRREEATKRPEQVKLLEDSLNRTQSLIDTIRVQIQEAAEALASSSLSSEDVVSTASVESTSAETASTPSASVSDDVFEGLDDEPYSSESSSSHISSTQTPTPLPSFSITPYTEEDLTEIVSTYDTIVAWLKEKIIAQEALSPAEDPAFLASEASAKVVQLNKAMTDMIQKRFKLPPRPKSSKSKTSKTTKSKVKSKKAKATESASASPIEADPPESSVVLADEPTEQPVASPQVDDTANTGTEDPVPPHGEL